MLDRCTHFAGSFRPRLRLLVLDTMVKALHVFVCWFDRVVCCLFVWLFGWLVGWLVDCLLVELFVCCFVFCLFVCLFDCLFVVGLWLD